MGVQVKENKNSSTLMATSARFLVVATGILLTMAVVGGLMGWMGET